MQIAIQRDGLRRRLAELISKRYGGLDSRIVGDVSRKARVHYTSLARYLLYPMEKRTATLRRRTLDAVALALDANPQWLRDGQAPKQLGLWPILLPSSAETAVADPADQVRSVFDQVARLPKAVQIHAYRAAVAAVLDVVVQEGQTLDDQAYRCLMRLDALRRIPSQRTG